MDFYNLGSIFIDISIGILVLRAIIRLVLTFTYFKRNGRRTLTDEQRKQLRKAITSITIAGILFGLASLFLLIIC